MACCNPTTINFFNVPSTTIAYGPALQALHGAAPRVVVLYWDGENYVAAGITTQVRFNTYPVTSITVDHGSDAATGIIKLG